MPTIMRTVATVEALLREYHVQQQDVIHWLIVKCKLHPVPEHLNPEGLAGLFWVFAEITLKLIDVALIVLRNANANHACHLLSDA